MTFDTNWDVETYKYEHELEHHWELKKSFMLAHKENIPEKRLVCLAQTFYNMEILGCRYDTQVMLKVRSLAEAVPSSARINKEKAKFSRGFVPASNAASERVKARLGVVVENSGRVDAMKPGEWAAKAAASKRQWDGGSVVSPPKRQAITSPTSNAPQVERAAWLDSVDVSSVVRSGPFGRVVLFEGNNGNDSPASVIERTASASHMTTSFNFVQSKQEVCCQFSLNGLFLASGTGETQKIAKDAACKQAIERLKQTCFTVQVKAAYVGDGSEVGRTLDRQAETETPVGTSLDRPLPSDNLGSKMLRLMGWSGGGLGKEGQGQEEPVPVDAQQVSRAGLGALGSLVDFKRKARALLEDFATSDSSKDLVFSPDLTKDERKTLHEMVRRYNLKSRSYGKGDESRHIVVFKKISPMEIVEELIERGGQTDKYLLLPPSSAH